MLLHNKIQAFQAKPPYTTSCQSISRVNCVRWVIVHECDRSGGSKRVPHFPRIPESPTSRTSWIIYYSIAFTDAFDYVLANITVGSVA